MGKKGQNAEVTEEKVVEPEPVAEVLEGDFIFPDGSQYSGQYLKKGDDVNFHGSGHYASGLEVFEGHFEHGSYKKGIHKSCNGSKYSGNFYRGVFHGRGEYTWPDGRVYRGMWKGGKMHGRGQYENFSYGTEKIVEGFSINGSFLSSEQGQKDARRSFLDVYGTEYRESALAILREIVAKMDASVEPADPKKGVVGVTPTVPKDFLVPSLPEEEAESEESVAARAAEQVVAGPFPDAAAINYTKLKAFAELFPEQGQITVYENKDASKSFEGSRLQCDQLCHVGQGVEFCHREAEAGAINVLVFVNVATDYDISCAQWKVAFCSEVPVPEVAPPVETAKEAVKEGKKK